MPPGASGSRRATLPGPDDGRPVRTPGPGGVTISAAVSASGAHPAPWWCAPLACRGLSPALQPPATLAARPEGANGTDRRHPVGVLPYNITQEALASFCHVLLLTAAFGLVAWSLMGMRTCLGVHFG